GRSLVACALETRHLGGAAGAQRMGAVKHRRSLVGPKVLDGLRTEGSGAVGKTAVDGVDVGEGLLPGVSSEHGEAFGETPLQARLQSIVVGGAARLENRNRPY